MQAVVSMLDGSRSEEALCEDEAQLGIIFEHSVVGIALLDAAGKIVRYNAALAELLGYSQSEIRGRNYLQLIHPDEADVSAAAFGELMQGRGGAARAERRLMCKNGQVITARITSSLYHPERGSPLGIIMIEDVTDLRNSETLAREASMEEVRHRKSSALRELLTLAGLGAVVFTLGCFFNLFEALFEILWRYRLQPVAQVFGTIIVLGPVLAVLAYRRWMETRSLAGESLLVAEALQSLNQDLEKRVQQRTAELLKGQAAMRCEVIERRNAEQAARESEERFRQLAQNIDQVFWIASPSRETFLYVSPAYEKIWGRTCQSLLDKPGSWLDAIHSADRQRVHRAAVANHRLSHYDETYRVVRPDGAVRWIRDRAFPLRDAAGDVYRVVGTATDITEAKQAEDELHKLSRAVEQSPASIIITDRAGRIEYINPKFTTVTGYSPEDVIGKTPRVLKSGEMLAADYQQLWSTITSGREWHGELHNRKKNGELFWEWASISPITDADGKISHFLAVKEDITQRKQLTEAMRESDERFRALVETAPDAIYIQGNGLFAYVNAAGLRLFGAKTPEDLIGKPVVDRVHPDYRSSFAERLHGTNELRQPVELTERKCLKIDGSSVEVETSAVPFTFNKNAGALVFARDITERQRARERICEQAALLDKAHDAICVQDFTQKIVYWNEGAQRLYGWTAAEAIGKDADHLLFNGEVPKPIDADSSLMRDGEWRGELNQVDRNGRGLIVESRWSLMRENSGKPKSILIINTDVTDKKLTEAKFLRTQRMENLGALAGGIAHDLNNVLSPVMMAAEALATENTSAEDRHMLDVIQTSARRGSEMVKQILSFARGVGGEHQPLGINHVISELEGFAKRTFSPAIEVRKFLARDLHLVQGDATQLHQVLLNLCVNARDAMPKGGTLTIEARNIDIDETYPRRQTSGPHILMTVSDTGHGIPAELLERIFEPFFTTKDLGKGTGLGLSTVLGIVKTHGGFLEVASEPAKGTTFRVYLPAIPGASQRADQAVPAAPDGHGESVLVVDDNAAILEMLKLGLEAHNYRLLTACDGAQALKLYEANQDAIKAVVTDMLMPSMNGAELIDALRKINPAIKIIGTTGQGSADELVRSAQANVECFLTKPFSTQSLLVNLHRVLGK